MLLEKDKTNSSIKDENSNNNTNDTIYADATPLLYLSYLKVIDRETAPTGKEDRIYYSSIKSASVVPNDPSISRHGSRDATDAAFADVDAVCG